MGGPAGGQETVQLPLDWTEEILHEARQQGPSCGRHAPAKRDVDTRWTAPPARLLALLTIDG